VKWVTREYAEADRIACPWLIRRFNMSRAAMTLLAFALLAWPAGAGVAAAARGAATGKSSTSGRTGGRMSLDPALIQRQTGATGAMDEKAHVFKVSVPRSDIAVTAAGARMTPAMGLTSWAAFQAAGTHAMVMGDLVLLEDQVNPVMSVALENGLDVTALHNHFFWETPRVFFMHIGGMGSQEALAGAVGKVFEKLKEAGDDSAETAAAGIDPAKTSLDPARIEAVLHEKGTLASGVYKVVVGRSTKEHGVMAGAAMGVNTWAAFAGSNERALVDGDFAVAEGELQDVLRALRSANFNIVAIHMHMTGETPRILFLHYWGVGPTEALARGLRAALDKTHAGGTPAPGAHRARHTGR
jgi:uncharacterized protein DUF1259/chromate resistance exported protein